MNRAWIPIAAGLVLFCGASASGQEHGAAPEHSEAKGRTGYTHYANHFGGLIGASFHLDDDESGGATTLGLEYARLLAPRWALAAITELVSSSLERDIILALGAIFYPVERVSLVLAPGLELASKDVEAHGTTETENETEFLLRLGVGYAFPIAPTASVGPTVLADYAGDRWTVLVALGMAVGF